MRIGFDCSVLARPHPAGVVRVVRETLAALERRGMIEVVRYSPEPGAALRRWRQWDWPRSASGLDGLHSFLSAFPIWSSLPRVCTIHELPWRHGESENNDFRHRLWTTLAGWRASRIVTATEFTARDLRANGSIAAHKLRVIPWGVGPEFVPQPSIPIERRIFCPGGARPKKRVDALWKALPPAQDWVLAISGPRTTWLDQLLARNPPAGPRLEFLGELDQEQLLREYQRAHAVALLSRSEGFGLPVLEAMACGTPILVPARSAQAEVAGTAALPVILEDPPSLQHALELAQSQRKDLAERGRARAQQFAWDRTAQALESLWKELLA